MADTDIDGLINLGLEAADDGNLERAEELLNEARAKAAPDHPRVLHLAGIIAIENGDFESAAKALMDADERSGGRDAAIVLTYAECLFSLQELEEAEAKIRQLLDEPKLSNDDADEARLLLAQLRHADDDPEEALEVLDGITEGRKTHAAYLSTRGMVLAADERFDEAVEALKAALVSEPNDPDLHYQLAVAYELTGHETNARESMVRVLQLELEEWEELGDDAPPPPNDTEKQELRERFEEAMTELPDPILKLVATAPISVQSRATEDQVRSGINPRSVVAFLGTPKRDDQDANLTEIVVMRDLLLFQIEDDEDVELELLEALSEELEYFFDRDFILAEV